MARQRWTRILAFLFLLSFLPCPGRAESWFCEGRPCAAASGGCCCDAGTGVQDPNCDVPAGRPPDPGLSECGAGCACVLVLTDCDHETRRTAARASSLALPAPALLPAPLTPCILFVPAGAAAAHPIVRRGPPPPLRSAAVGAHGLRAPPAA